MYIQSTLWDALPRNYGIITQIDLPYISQQMIDEMAELTNKGATSYLRAIEARMNQVTIIIQTFRLTEKSTIKSISTNN